VRDERRRDRRRQPHGRARRLHRFARGGVYESGSKT
jgi:hypothetical protein